MLRAAGAPTKDRPIASEIRLMHGTLWHEWFRHTLIKRGIPFFHELNLTPYMPPGWGGTADWIFWSQEYKAFVLGDLKTSKGEAIYWINRNGAKEDHIWQLSSYYYALLAMGLPMVKGFGVLYWPMNDDSSNEVILPTVQECDPLPEDEVLGRMTERWAATQLYLSTTADGITPTQAKVLYSLEGEQFIQQFLNEELAPEQERIQKIIWNKLANVFDLKLVPHWSAAFCDWSSPLCECSSRGTTKIGHYTLDGEFVPRRGYEGVNPTVRPSLTEFKKRTSEGG